MKKLKWIWVLILAICGVNCSAQTAQNDVVNFLDAVIGVVANNRVQFYALDDDSWTHYPAVDLTLPDGYRNIFSLDDCAGVIIDNKVQFYRFDGSSWAHVPEMEFALPNGYKNVFSILDESIGVVNNNTLYTYQYDKSWVHEGELDFMLPKGYKSIFEFKGDIGVAVGDKVQFYEPKDAIMTYIPDFDLMLPDGYEGVFEYDDEVAVVVNNTVQFYGHFQEEWEHIPLWEFVIEEISQSSQENKNAAPKISSGKEGMDWSFQDMLQYLDSSFPNFQYNNTDLGVVFGPAVYFEWSDTTRVYVQARTSAAEARNAADQAILDGRYAFSWGRFWFYSIDKSDIDVLKKYFP